MKAIRTVSGIIGGLACLAAVALIPMFYIMGNDFYGFPLMAPMFVGIIIDSAVGLIFLFMAIYQFISLGGKKNPKGLIYPVCILSAGLFGFLGYEVGGFIYYVFAGLLIVILVLKIIKITEKNPVFSYIVSGIFAAIWIMILVQTHMFRGVFFYTTILGVVAYSFMFSEVKTFVVKRKKEKYSPEVSSEDVVATKTIEGSTGKPETTWEENGFVYSDRP